MFRALCVWMRNQVAVLPIQGCKDVFIASRLIVDGVIDREYSAECLSVHAVT